MNALLAALLAGVLADTLTDRPTDPPIDPATGLKMAPGWELVRAHCSGCHSLKLVSSQRGNRATWLTTIRWMQEKQNLWPIPAEQESELLSYLSTQYAPEAWGRRPPLPASLMPPGPSASRRQ